MKHAPLPDAHPITERPVNALLRIEGGAVFLFALAIFIGLGASWWLFFALILVPDLSALGYLINNRVGAWCYNLAHLYLVPILLAVVGLVLGYSDTTVLAAVWLAHIGADRALGYGLKSSSGPKATHLSLKPKN